MVLPGAVGVAVFGYYALADWAALQAAYKQFETAAAQSRDVPTLFVTEAKQNIHRINLFADGVWTLLSAILAAVGLHGLCHDRPPQTTREN